MQKWEPSEGVVIKTADRLRWQLAAHCASRAGGVWCPADAIFFTREGGLRTAMLIGGSRGASHWFTAVVFVIATLCALPHFLGWDASFPTPLECKLWRIATVGMVALGSIFCGIGLFNGTFMRIAPRPLDKDPGVAFLGFQLLAAIVTMVLYSMCLALYPSASAYLIVESVRQLSSLVCPMARFCFQTLQCTCPISRSVNLPALSICHMKLKAANVTQ